MDINIGVKIHNRFDIEVRNVKTGEVTQRGQAENIILDRFYTEIIGTSLIDNIAYGDGDGTPTSDRTDLFNFLARKKMTSVERKYEIPPSASYRKDKITILTDEAVGKTITEVGISFGKNLGTHAMITDSEGNKIGIGPKTDLEEITIYSTLYATIDLPEGIDLTNINNNIVILNALGLANIYSNRIYGGLRFGYSKDKAETDPTKEYPISSNDTLHSISEVGTSKVGSNGLTTGRVRTPSANANGKVWSIWVAHYDGGDFGTTRQAFRMLFPSPIFPGYKIQDKNFGVGDGVKTKFVLPWSDINDSKEYKFYIDNALQTENTHYTLDNSENETSITFVNPPSTDTVISGDWWVDYIPKDTDHVLDLTVNFTFGEGGA